MGKEIHRQRLISQTQLDGCEVIVDMVKHDGFSMVMFEKYIEVNYPTASISTTWSHTELKRCSVKFQAEPEAIDFHLRHHN